MSDYTKSTDFASKDALPSGNAAKIVKGTEIDTEFNNIAVAVATKADLASPGFSGSPTAPTQSTGDNTSKLATTGFVQAALSALYPVGSIYTNAAVSTNPATLLGFGTWSAFGAGRVMVGLDAGNAAFDTAQETGGSADAIVVSHTHSFSGTTGDVGNHEHNLQKLGSAQAGQDNGGAPISSSTGYSTSRNLSPTEGAGGHDHSFSGTTASTGSSATNANLPPYVVVYMWRRTA
jgi:hypothetical protein